MRGITQRQPRALHSLKVHFFERTKQDALFSLNAWVEIEKGTVQRRGPPSRPTCPFSLPDSLKYSLRKQKRVHPPQLESGPPSFFQDSALSSKLSDSLGGSLFYSSLIGGGREKD